MRPLGPQRLKAAVLSIIDDRVRVCREAEARYAEDNAMIHGEMRERALATERCARMEAEYIRERIAALPAAGRALKPKDQTP